MLVGGYSLDLYCEYEQDKKIKHSMIHIDSASYFKVNGIDLSFQFSGETFTECAKQARQAGWKLSKKYRTAVCPVCSKMGRKL